MSINDHNRPRMNEDRLPFYDVYDQESFLRQKLSPTLEDAGYDPKTLHVQESGAFLFVCCRDGNGTLQTLATLPSSESEMDLKDLTGEEAAIRKSNILSGVLATLIRRNLSRERTKKSISSRVKHWFSANVEQTPFAKRIKVFDELVTDPIIEHSYECGEMTISNMEHLVTPKDTITVKRIRFGLDENDMEDAKEAVRVALRESWHSDNRVYLQEIPGSQSITLFVYLVPQPPVQSDANDFWDDEDDV